LGTAIFLSYFPVLGPVPSFQRATVKPPIKIPITTATITAP